MTINAFIFTKNTWVNNMMLLRKKKGISQADLGKQIGASGDVIGRYERGLIYCSNYIYEIVKSLKVYPPKELFGF
jgi:transcriptional regulator with XRE-family HTH domain